MDAACLSLEAGSAWLSFVASFPIHFIIAMVTGCLRRCLVWDQAHMLASISISIISAAMVAVMLRVFSFA